MNVDLNLTDVIGGGLSWPPSLRRGDGNLKRPRSPQEHVQQQARLCPSLRPAPIELVLTLEEMYAGCTKMLPLAGGALALPVTLAPGLRTGTTITLAAAANVAGAGGGPLPSPPPTAAVTLVIREAAHARFRRLGDDLLAVAPLPLLLALTGGGSVTLPRLCGGGELRVDLPDGAVVRPGQVFTLRGEGMPRASDPTRRGDLHIRVQVAFPSGLGRLTDAQRAALRAALQGCDG